MQITIQSKALAHALGLSKAVVAKNPKSPLPILGCVKVHAEPFSKRVTFTSTDLDNTMHLAMYVENTNNTATGETVCLPLYRLAPVTVFDVSQTQAVDGITEQEEVTAPAASERAPFEPVLV